ncbi:MAG: sorbosone dehydrogenase family protein [Thermoleophilia bacterium]
MALLALLATASTASADPPAGFEVRTLVGDLTGPTAFAYAPDGRIFIAERAGLVKVWDGRQSSTFIDLRPDVNDFGERGLLGIALDPGFATNGWVYLGFVKEPDPSQPNGSDPTENTVIRVRASASDPNAADPASRETVLDDLPQTGPWHAVGQLAFDGQGSLLVGLGDGSCYDPGLVNTCGFDVFDLDSPVGKVLRLDPETGDGDPRNPYFDAAAPASNRSRVLARGFRNPYRFSVDGPTGDIWVGDVGNGAFEEIDRIPATWTDPDRELNFGWPCYEGPLKQPAYSSNPISSGTCAGLYPPAEGGTGIGAAAPAYAWPHTGGGEAVVAGPVYRGGAYPSAYAGRLFFANFVKDEFFTRTPDGTVTPFGTSGGFGQATDIQEGPGGSIVYADIASGAIKEIVNVSAGNPPGGDPGPAPGPGPGAGPASDADSDGVPDAQDRCPAVPGPASRQGCPAAAASRRKVTLKLSAKPVRVGARRFIRVSGTTRPALRGRTVIVERRNGRRATRLCTAKTGRKGTFAKRCAVPSRVSGVVRVRARLATTATTRAATTKYVRVAAPRR